MSTDHGSKLENRHSVLKALAEQRSPMRLDDLRQKTGLDQEAFDQLISELRDDKKIVGQGLVITITPWGSEELKQWPF